MAMSRAQLVTYSPAPILAELERRWEQRPGAPHIGSAGPFQLSELCKAVGLPMPTGALKPATDALGEALGDHHVLYARPVHVLAPLNQGGSGRLDASDVELTIWDVAALAPAMLEQARGLEQTRG